MASIQDSSHEHDDPTNKLNNAILDCAASFIRRELQQLTQECNEVLGRLHVPQLKALLVEVDKQRQSFDNAKRKMLQDLREKLEVLGVERSIVDSHIADLQKMNPAYLDAIPNASSLSDRLPTPIRSPSSESQLTSLAETADIGRDFDGPPSSPDPDGDELADFCDYDYSTSEMNRSLRTRRGIVDHELQQQLAAEVPEARNSLKRSRTDAFGPETDVAGPKVRQSLQQQNYTLANLISEI